MKGQYGTALRLKACREQGQHTLVWCGVALCCITEQREDEKREPRSYTLRSVA
jgi:hypothetical protein